MQVEIFTGLTGRLTTIQWIDGDALMRAKKSGFGDFVIYKNGTLVREKNDDGDFKFFTSTQILERAAKCGP